MNATFGRFLKCGSPLISLHLSCFCFDSNNASISPNFFLVFLISSLISAAFSQSSKIIGQSVEFACTTSNIAWKLIFDFIVHIFSSAMQHSIVMNSFFELFSKFLSMPPFSVPLKYSTHANVSIRYVVMVCRAQFPLF